jgi:transposase
VDILVERCAALDVHKDTVVACVRVPGERQGGQRHQELRRFQATTAGLLTLADWLASFGVTLVGMEATGCYWMPVWQVLEERVECWLLNARHVRNLPGRKTDMADAAWLCQLLEHGMVRPSFVPPHPIRELRDLTRYRTAQVQERTRELQRLDKVLQGAGIKLSSVASRTLGVSARLMLEALTRGTHDPEVLADLAKGRLRQKLPALREALAGRFRTEHHGLLVSQILAHVDYLDEMIALLSRRIEQVIGPFTSQVALLRTIPGVDKRLAEVLIAELGVDMDVFPTHQQLASWAGMCPGNNESAGKRKSGTTRKGSKWLRSGLVEAAKGAARAKGSYFAAQYARLKGRRGHGRATIAVGHSILVTVYYVLKRGVPYQELGDDYFQQRQQEAADRYAKRLVRQLQHLGHKVTLEPADAA